MGESMNIHKIIGFCAAARYGSFSKAAASTFMTQPAFSRMISSIEEEFGCKLFERSKTETVLTPIGRELLPEMQAIVSHYERAAQMASQYNPRAEKNIVISSFRFGWSDECRALCASHLRLFPETGIRFLEESGTSAFEALRSGEIDFLHTMYTPTRYETLLCAIPAESFRHRAYLSSGHPLAGRREISLRELRHEGFICFPRDQFPLMFERVTKACADEGFIPEVVYETDNLPLMMNRISTGDGVAVVPDFVQVVPGVSAVPIKEIPAEPSYWFWWKQNDRPEVLAFADFLRRLAIAKGRMDRED